MYKTYKFRLYPTEKQKVLIRLLAKLKMTSFNLENILSFI